jgi:alpha-glucosidase
MTNPASFQSHLSHTLGKLLSYVAHPSGISGLAEGGYFKVVVYSEAVSRIHLTRRESFDDFSYATIAEPDNISVLLDDQSDKIILRTTLFQLHIEKNPLRFIFLNADGVVLNEDDPGLRTSWIGDQVTAYKKLQDGERFIGLGEKTGSLDRKGSGYQNWTTDAYAYHSGSDPLYCSTPFYIGIHHHLTYGVFFDNSFKTFFNFGASNNRFSSFGADAGEMNYYLFAGSSVSEIIRSYTWLTGRMELPPRWSLGYQQCRYSYYPDKEVIAAARTFREKDIPADVIVLDIHYMDKYKIFTWDKKNFSDPKKLMDDLKNMGFHIVLICDPGIKKEAGYEPYDDGVRQDVFIKYPDGENYEGQVWPGWCHFPDFTNPKTRKWWATKFQNYVDLGVDGFWNDMNEIATWGHSLPENLAFDFDGNGSTTRRGRNLYGFQMARSTFEGTKNLLQGRRPFNLTRSGFSGVQRYSAVWTGDNVSYDEHMMLGVRLVNSLGLTGIAFAGYDVGGFVGDAGTTLFARWITIGALSPFFRGHTMINSRDSEPWSYGEEVEQISRNYIKLRYQLMPYIYSLFYDASMTGMPVQRSLALDYSHHPQVYDPAFHHEYLFGPFILVAPVESNKELTRVYLPPGDWYYLFNGEKFHGDREIMLACPVHKLPIFIKAGAVLPMQVPRPNTTEKYTELILHLYPEGPETSFSYYMDDGISYEYQKGKKALRSIRHSPNQNKLIVGKTDGDYSSGLSTIKVVFHNMSKGSAFIDGREEKFSSQLHSFFTPLEKYDPINEPDSMGEEEVKYMVIPYSDEELIISW